MPRHARPAASDAPLEARNSRERSTIVSPFQVITMRGSSVTVGDHRGLEVLLAGVARGTRPRPRRPRPRPCAPGIRRWPARCRPGPRTSWARVLRSMYRPSASSPTATDTPPAPKSLQRLIRRQASPRRNRRCSLRSTGALPFCTSAPSSLQRFARYAPWKSRWRRRCRHGRCGRPAG